MRHAALFIYAAFKGRTSLRKPAYDGTAKCVCREVQSMKVYVIKSPRLLSGLLKRIFRS